MEKRLLSLQFWRHIWRDFGTLLSLETWCFNSSTDFLQDWGLETGSAQCTFSLAASLLTWLYVLSWCFSGRTILDSFDTLWLDKRRKVLVDHAFSHSMQGSHLNLSRETSSNYYVSTFMLDFGSCVLWVKFTFHRPLYPTRVADANDWILIPSYPITFPLDLLWIILIFSGKLKTGLYLCLFSSEIFSRWWHLCCLHQTVLYLDLLQQEDQNKAGFYLGILQQVAFWRCVCTWIIFSRGSSKDCSVHGPPLSGGLSVHRNAVWYRYGS